MPEPTQPAAIPPQAITAAAKAVGASLGRGEPSQTIAVRALEAAAPHLAAAERERLVPVLWKLREVIRSGMEYPVEAVPWSAVLSALGSPVLADADPIAEAVAAGRNRCAQLAGSLKFTLWRPAANGPGGDTQSLDVVPLTELLAALCQDEEGGGT